MTTLTDDALTRLLTEAAQEFGVPDDGPVAVLAAEAPRPVVPLRRRRAVGLLAAAAAVGAVVLGGALVTGGDEAPTREAQQAAPAEEAASNEESAAPENLAEGGQLGALSDLTSVAGGAAAPAPAAAADAARLTVGTAAPAAPGPAQAAAQAPVPDGARVVKTGSVALIVGDGRVTPTLTAVQEQATSAGGLVQSAETQESGRTPSGKVVLRVPVDRFEQVVTGVRSLDAEVRAASTSGRDVTAEYTDLEAQLRTLRAARERFLEILGGTRAIGDVLAVQQRVDDVTGQIDRLEGQRALLQSQSDSATLEVTVTEADDPVVTATERPDDGLSKALRDAGEGFTSGVEALVAASGRAALVLLCLLVALGVARLLWRAGRRRLV